MTTVIAADELRAEHREDCVARVRMCVCVTWNPFRFLVKFIFLFFSSRFLHNDDDGSGDEAERKKTDRAPHAYAHGE